MMRLVLASDTHEQHAGLIVPDGDVFVHAGDFTYRGDLAAIRAFGAWLQALPHRHKIVIAGNHDFAFERMPPEARRSLGDGANGITYLEDSGTTIDEISIWGSPWQPWFYDWAFNLHRGAALAAVWARIPAATDVLVTHGPPQGILDSTGSDAVGCADLAERVRALRPRLHVFGHIHEGSGQRTEDGTTFVNASICDVDYRPINPIRVIDL